LITALKIKLSDLTTLQPCIFLAVDNPSHLDRGLEEVMGRILLVMLPLKIKLLLLQ
jgi:hypothetical protein